MKSGTSIIATLFDGGVIIGSDSRTTRGSKIENRACNKVTQISKYIMAAWTGNVADAEKVCELATVELSIYKMEHKQEPPIEVAAHRLSKLITPEMMLHIIVAGWHPKRGYKIFTIVKAKIEERYSVLGSGSPYMLGYCDYDYKEGMKEEDARKFAVNALKLAIDRDGSSGGAIRIATIKNSGVEEKIYIT